MQLSHHEWPSIIVGVMWVRLKTKWVYKTLFPRKKTYGLLREHVREDFPRLSCCLAPGASGEEVPSQREAVSQDAFLVMHEPRSTLRLALDQPLAVVAVHPAHVVQDEARAAMSNLVSIITITIYNNNYNNYQY